MRGLISQTLNWITHPTNADPGDTDPKAWAAGLVLILMAAFLWSTVIKQIE